ncbi:MAG: hypothetical protein ACXU89_18790, partial [Xanthobacteraceae bacterium]
LGHTTTGLRASAQSFSGSVIVNMYAKGDEDWCCITARRGSKSYGGDVTIYDGPVERLTEQSGRKTMLEHLAADVLLNG